MGMTNITICMCPKCKRLMHVPNSDATQEKVDNDEKTNVWYCAQCGTTLTGNNVYALLPMRGIKWKLVKKKLTS